MLGQTTILDASTSSMVSAMGFQTTRIHNPAKRARINKTEVSVEGAKFVMLNLKVEVMKTLEMMFLKGYLKPVMKNPINKMENL